MSVRVHPLRATRPGVLESAIAARRRIAPERALQVALGSLWMLDGALQFQPFMFGSGFVTQVIAPNATGQPGVVGAPIVWISHLIAPRVVLFNAFAASLQVLIGLGLLQRRTVRPALIASFAWAFGVWWFGEGFGMLLTGTASPLTGAPGAVVLYAVLGLIAWPPRRGAAWQGGLLGAEGARLAWAALWLLYAGLWLAPANRGPQASSAAIAAAPGGFRWLESAQSAAAGAAAGHGLQIAIVLAIASIAIAVSIALDWRPRAFLALACAISLVCWVLGQGLGGILTGTATDPSTGPPLVLLALALGLLPAQAHTLPAWRRPTQRRRLRLRRSHVSGAGSAA